MLAHTLCNKCEFRFSVRKTIVYYSPFFSFIFVTAALFATAFVAVFCFLLESDESVRRLRSQSSIWDLNYLQLFPTRLLHSFSAVSIWFSFSYSSSHSWYNICLYNFQMHKSTWDNMFILFPTFIKLYFVHFDGFIRPCLLPSFVRIHQKPSWNKFVVKIIINLFWRIIVNGILNWIVCVNICSFLFFSIQNWKLNGN